MIPAFVAGNFVEWAMHSFVMHRQDRRLRAARDLRPAHPPAPPVLHRQRCRHRHGARVPHRLLPVAGADGARRRRRSLGWLIGARRRRQRRLHRLHDDDRLLHDLRDLPLLLPRARQRFVRHMPFVNTIRRHHTAHHNMGIMMHFNMNLTFPIADWFMSTSDLERGLLGHLFNGYDERHVKPALEAGDGALSQRPDAGRALHARRAPARRRGIADPGCGRRAHLRRAASRPRERRLETIGYAEASIREILPVASCHI